MKTGPYFLIFASLARWWSGYIYSGYIYIVLIYVLIALSTGSVILKLESTIYQFSLIFRVFVAFLKKKIIQFL